MSCVNIRYVHVHVHVCAYVVAMVMSPQEYIPLPLPEDGESPSFQYSAVECALFAFNQIVQKVLHHHYIITKSHDPHLTYMYCRFLNFYRQKRIQNDSKTSRKGWCVCTQVQRLLFFSHLYTSYVHVCV